MSPLREPSRLAFAGDWHANADWSVSAVKYAADHGAEAIVHLGDFGYLFQRPFLDVLTSALVRAGMPLLFVDGNHECFPTLLRHPVGSNGLRPLTTAIWHLPRGFRWTWGDTTFLALGGAYSVDRPWRRPGVSWWKEEALTSEDVALAKLGGRADVLVSHDCPADVTVPGVDDQDGLPPFPPLELLRAEEHRRALRGVVDVVQPEAIWHGHYHVDYRTTVDLGYGPVAVTGLDRDDTSLPANVRVVDLSEICPRGGRVDRDVKAPGS